MRCYLDYLSEPNVITGPLEESKQEMKTKAEMRERETEREWGEERFEDTKLPYCWFEERKEPQAKECIQHLEAGKSKETDSSLEPPGGFNLY